MGPERRRWLLALAPLLLFAGCATPPGDQDSAPARPRDVSNIPDAVPQAEPRSRRGNPPVYEVMGRRYYVMNDAAGYRERGVASWYGTKFHGRLTSSGEPYDMYAMTAAHKTLPLPSYVRVTHLGNGRSVIVRVNDRGPFIGERIIDLSYAAAVRLGMQEEGTALVDVEIVGPGTTAATAPAGKPAATATAVAGPVWLQVGAFSDADNAARLEARLAEHGIGEVVTRQERRRLQTIYRVRIGPLASVDEIEGMLARVRALGFDDAHLAAD
ncbi:septal ring lytic transglycosylase RlpA family protein [Thioalkalivibrio sp. XN8]|uniref:septal ring lytic transglycosylase RlpA family protein n=1 Tax=Thioalkalivibrio sp. XN8 TaxID=2712863 RepID=UPI0013EA1FF2|nr:septal ring lytic transglycosylase RlpA family protein [Thioalkalivibrio sp. XN8]NGP54146.1 septal ring lytic transglycosylase RlpA family protein [Thioalkalivibrio sp. XN8]